MQASRQSWRELARRRAFKQLAAFSKRTKKSKSETVRPSGLRKYTTMRLFLMRSDSELLIFIFDLEKGWACLGQFLCSRIGGLKRAVSDRRPNRAFLRSRKSAFSIPFFLIEQSDPHNPSRKTTFSTRCTDRIARSKKFFKPTASLTTPENTRSHPTTAPMRA